MLVWAFAGVSSAAFAISDVGCAVSCRGVRPSVVRVVAGSPSVRRLNFREVAAGFRVPAVRGDSSAAVVATVAVDCLSRHSRASRLMPLGWVADCAVGGCCALAGCAPPWRFPAGSVGHDE